MRKGREGADLYDFVLVLLSSTSCPSSSGRKLQIHKYPCTACAGDTESLIIPWITEQPKRTTTHVQLSVLSGSFLDQSLGICGSAL
jgi:hypothetical protein